MKKKYYILFCFILIGCAKDNYTMQKKEICNISQNLNSVKVDCNENSETYHIKNNNFNNRFLNCKKISFEIRTNNKKTKKNYLECDIEGNKKKIYFFE